MFWPRDAVIACKFLHCFSGSVELADEPRWVRNTLLCLECINYGLSTRYCNHPSS